MTGLNLKDALDRLGLLQSEFARLVDVSPRTISLWATGEKSMPGPATAYLRLLERLPKDVLTDELKRLERRPKMFDQGIYSLHYRGRDMAEHDGGNALAVLRNGKIFGSDRWGGVFAGSYEFDAADESTRVHVRIDVPPNGELVTGFAAGPKGASIDIAGKFDRPAPQSISVVEVAGRPVEVQLTYLGPLPN